MKEVIIEELKKVSYVIPIEKEQDFLTVIDLADAIKIVSNWFESVVMLKNGDNQTKKLFWEIFNAVGQNKIYEWLREGGYTLSHYPQTD